tara:strand:- start:261 stop:755 length:495 start_codon:yes stop_codon:yes gene_type:complete
MASSLVWALTRDNNSFLHLRGRTSRQQEIQLSSEKGNVMAAKTFKYSGVANDATIDLSQGTNKKGKLCVVLSKGKASKKGSNYETKEVYTAKQLEKALKGFRGDLKSAAMTKFKKLARGASNANGYTKGAKKASNRAGTKAEFTFTKKIKHNVKNGKKAMAETE